MVMADLPTPPLPNITSLRMPMMRVQSEERRWDTEGGREIDGHAERER